MSYVGLMFAASASALRLVEFAGGRRQLGVFSRRGADAKGLVVAAGSPLNVFSLAGLTIISALGLLTHPIFIFFMAACNCAASLVSRRAFWMVTICNALGVGLFLAAWGPFVFSIIGLPTTSWMEVPGLGDLLQGYLNLLGDYDDAGSGGVRARGFVVEFPSARLFFCKPNRASGCHDAGRKQLVAVCGVAIQAGVLCSTPSLFFPIACVAVALLVSRFRHRWAVAVGLATLLEVPSSGCSMRRATTTIHPDRASEIVIDSAKPGDILISGGLAINEVTCYFAPAERPGRPSA